MRAPILELPPLPARNKSAQTTSRLVTLVRLAWFAAVIVVAGGVANRGLADQGPEVLGVDAQLDCPLGTHRQVRALGDLGHEAWCAFPDGMREGPTARFYEDGVCARRGQYERGEPVGVWTSWYASGETYEVIDYGSGDAAPQRTMWGAEGQVATQGPDETSALGTSEATQTDTREPLPDLTTAEARTRPNLAARPHAARRGQLGEAAFVAAQTSAGDAPQWNRPWKVRPRVAAPGATHRRRADARPADRPLEQDMGRRNPSWRQPIGVGPRR